MGYIIQQHKNIPTRMCCLTINGNDLHLKQVSPG